MGDTKTILVPVDFSTHSRAAALRACDLALARDATIHLIHALDVSGGSRPDDRPPKTWDELRISGERQLTILADDLSERGARMAVTLAEREPVAMIREFAGHESVDLIVVGSHGFGGLDRIFSGSVAEQAVQDPIVPVMMVKETEVDAASRIRRILLPTDFSPDSEAPLRLAIEWARLLDADVEVFHAIQGEGLGLASSEDPSAGDASRVMRQKALDELQSILTRLGDAGIRAGADLTYGPASIEIAKRAQQSRANLVVLGRSGRKERSRDFWGSSAKRVMQHVKCSVLFAPSGS